jgi:PAS domain S-box-containing protein
VKLENHFPGFETIINLLPAHVYILDINNLYVTCNKLQAQSFGFDDIKKVVGKRNRETPLYSNQQDLAETLDNNNMAVMRNKNIEIVELEEPGLDLNGNFVVFKSYKLPLLNEDKQVIGLLGISYDITKYKNELEALHSKYVQSELALDNIMANLPGHVYWTDEKNQCLGCNDQQAYELGLKNRHEIVGLNISALQPPENAAIVIKNNNLVMKTGEEITTEENFKDINGVDKVYLSRKTPLKNKSGKIVGLLGISLDITAQKEAEKLREQIAMHEAMAAKNKLFKDFTSQMLSLINHFQILNDNGKSKLVNEKEPNPNIKLTKRETEILYYLSRGKKPKDIAFKLDISHKTVQNIIDGQLFPKLDTHNIGDLIEKAHMWNLIPLIPEV